LWLAFLFCTRPTSDPRPPRGPPLSGEGVTWNSRIARAAGSSLVFRSKKRFGRPERFFVCLFRNAIEKGPVPFFFSADCLIFTPINRNLFPMSQVRVLSVAGLCFWAELRRKSWTQSV
jgi:hypothetical protein